MSETVDIQEAASMEPTDPLRQELADGRSDSRTDKIAAALAKAQGEIKNPPRNREVTVVSKRTGGKYTFKYATLDQIYDTIRKPLTQNGLWIVQPLESDGNGKYRLVTRIIHESGQEISSVTPLLVEDASNQSFGSALTYMRRYALCSLLGIAADEDDDANAADGNEVKGRKPTPDEVVEKRQAEKDAHEAANPPKKWIGPLTVTELKSDLRDYIAAVNDCVSEDEVIVKMDEYAAVMGQAKADLPDWHSNAEAAVNKKLNSFLESGLTPLDAG